MAAIPPLLNPGQHGWGEPSCSGSSGLLFPFSCSCCSLLDSPASYPCQRKTTAVPSPTTLPDHSTPCSDTPTVLRHSEARYPPHKYWQHEGDGAHSNPRLREKSGILGEGLWWQPRLSSIPSVCKDQAFGHGLETTGKEQTELGQCLLDTLGLNTKEIKLRTYRVPWTHGIRAFGTANGSNEPSGQLSYGAAPSTQNSLSQPPCQCHTIYQPAGGARSSSCTISRIVYGSFLPTLFYFGA